MSIFSRISSGLWSYISPRETQKRRDKPFRAPQPPLAHRTKSARSMSPSSVVNRWQVDSPGSSRHPPSTYLQDESSTMEEDLEGDTLMDDIPEDAEEDDVGSEREEDEEDEEDLEGDTLMDLPEGSAYDDYNANKETKVVDPAQYVQNKRAAHSATSAAMAEKRVKQADELRENGFTEEMIMLYQKIAKRGREPILSSTWKWDFPTLPTNLFTSDNEKTYINSLSDKSLLHGTRAFQALISIGPSVRDSLINEKPHRPPGWHRPEEYVRRAVIAYQKWSFADADLTVSKSTSPSEQFSKCSPMPPVLVIKSGPGTAKAADLEAMMVAKFQALADKHWAWMEVVANLDEEGKDENGEMAEVPTLYGIISSHTIIVFAAYDPYNPEAGARTIATFDYGFGKEGYDVWNGIAIAILIMHCRNILMDLKEKYGIENPPKEPESDPDL